MDIDNPHLKLPEPAKHDDPDSMPAPTTWTTTVSEAHEEAEHQDDLPDLAAAYDGLTPETITRATSHFLSSRPGRETQDFWQRKLEVAFGISRKTYNGYGPRPAAQGTVRAEDLVTEVWSHDYAEPANLAYHQFEGGVAGTLVNRFIAEQYPHLAFIPEAESLVVALMGAAFLAAREQIIAIASGHPGDWTKRGAYRFNIDDIGFPFSYVRDGHEVNLYITLQGSVVAEVAVPVTDRMMLF